MIPGVFAAAAQHGDAPALWTPADMSVPPSIWHDWTSDVHDVSGRAGEWEDISGNDVHYLQSTGARRPLITTGTPANIRVLNFDSSSRAMQASGGRDVVRNADGLWAFAIISRTSVVAGANNMAWLNNDVGSTTVALRGSDGGNNHAARFRRLGADPVAQIAGLNSSAWHIHACVADFAAGTASYLVDGSSLGSASVTVGSTPDADATISPGVGAWDGLHEGGVFQIAANLVGRGPLATGDRQKLEGWAAWSCGLQGNLPVDHPYRSAPPTL